VSPRTRRLVVSVTLVALLVVTVVGALIR